MFILIFITIFFISFILAFRSMKDFGLPKEVKQLIKIRKVKGTILFLKDRIKHYQ